jgi:hypothetical protein
MERQRQRQRERERERVMGKMDVASSMIRHLENEKVKIY